MKAGLLILPFLALLIGAVGISAFNKLGDPGTEAYWRLAVGGFELGPKLGLSVAGALVMFVGVYFWSLEGNEGYHLHLDKDGNPVKDGHGHGKH